MSLLIRVAGSSDAAAIGQIHAEGWRTALGSGVTGAVSTARDAERRRREWDDWFASRHARQVAYIAEDPERGIVGFLMAASAESNAHGAHGEIRFIHVRTGLHGQGIGRRLMTVGASWLAEHGLQPVIVWTPKANPYRGFYGALGGHHVGDRTRAVDGRPVLEAAYLWPRAEDLKAEAARSVPV